MKYTITAIIYGQNYGYTTDDEKLANDKINEIKVLVLSGDATQLFLYVYKEIARVG